MEITLQGKEIQLQRKIKLWKEWYKLHHDPIRPLSLSEIARMYRKPNGEEYTRAGIYKGLRRLRELAV